MLINSKIFEKAGVSFYDKIAKVASAGQKATAANIANVSTPGYKARSVDFKTEMKKYLEQKSATTPTTTNPKHIPIGMRRNSVKIMEPDTIEEASGMNNVDVEKEMVNLSENQLLYELGAKKLARTFGLLRAAIRGRSQ